ncbi:seminal metalloprotease 1 [Drosophila serrata]|uniref:seminal metalloprotease 1 n=1 Tax=Drosophila serrata TaxID=7274 RepID=UPI000A1CFA03|nr:seminal metalloprotease 1 [Drosophila serrata]
MLGLKLVLILLFCWEPLNALESDPELTSTYYQGDILNRGAKRRNGIGNEIFRWPNATVRYFIQPNVFDKAQLAHISEAMATIMNNSCITYVIAKEEELPLALNITGLNDGCNTEVLGYRKNAPNRINLQPHQIGKGCFRIGSIMHELLHSLGFEHQHVSQNRDEYVRIEWENIDKNQFTNFINEDDTTHWHNFGEAYDYNSVMHYLPMAFSKNGQPTIVALKKGNYDMGQRIKMTKSDIRKLNKMYKCHGYV